jgi:hypothetical protein
MREKKIAALAVVFIALIRIVNVAPHAMAQDAPTPYPNMAPVDQYLMDDRASEIALARSAAPESISRDAEIMVLSRHGYETAVKGKNGFVCVVERSWNSPLDHPNFWNPKLRGPDCYNAAAARTYLPRIIKRAELFLAGRTKAQMVEAITAAIDKKELPPIEPGAMSYMLSSQQFLDDQAPHWHPHLMFYYSQTDASAWGADLPGSPVLSSDDPWEHLITFMIPVRRWSDGTLDH